LSKIPSSFWEEAESKMLVKVKIMKRKIRSYVDCDRPSVHATTGLQVKIIKI
jgi:hypothetical protein